MQIIDGKAVSAQVLEECKERVAALKQRGVTPGLAVVLVGEDPASRAYVGSKARTCEALGMFSVKEELPASTTREELLALVESLNRRDDIHGILVQFPLPSHLDEAEVIRTLNPAKDVDGLHPLNIAKLAMEDLSAFVSCTPLGCHRLLQAAGVKVEGSHVVIIGRSKLVGKPLALLLMAKDPSANATVTVVHSRSRNLQEITRSADILVAAIGRPNYVKAEHVKEGAVVIDVGINRVDDPSAKKGYKLVGDVDYEAVAPKCSAITPVPGGVGPMTIAMLMSNTLKAAEATLG